MKINWFVLMVCYFVFSSKLFSQNSSIPTSYPNSGASASPYAQKHYADLKRAELEKERVRAQKDFEEKLAYINAEKEKIRQARISAQLEPLNKKLIDLEYELQKAKNKLDLDFLKTKTEIENQKLKIATIEEVAN
jgi:uncharacterized membrane protein YdfJ with MMPL/SSD domain